MKKRKIKKIIALGLILLGIGYKSPLFNGVIIQAEEVDLGSYDVIVCGAEPEGIAAAVSASRNGLKTLLIDEREIPGGLYTCGMLAMIDLNYDGGTEKLPIVNQGLFAEMYQSIGHGGAIDCQQTEAYFTKLLERSGVDTLYQVKDITPNVEGGTIKGLNMARQLDGSIIINAFQIFDVDSLRKESKQQAYEKAKLEIPYIIQYLRKQAPGFEKAVLGQIAEQLYVREGVRIVGEETLTAEDCFSGKKLC